MSEQLSLLEKAMLSDNLAKKKKSVKRKWEYAFQKWSDKHGIESDTIVIEWNGEAHTISEWAEITGISRSTLNNRHWRGWNAERMLTAPVTHGNQYTFYKAEREAKECHAT